MSQSLNISEAASIALHAMIFLAEKAGEPVSNYRIASAFNVSANHSAKVMQRLQKAGFITALRGPGGGYVLQRNPEEISLLEIYRAIDGKPTRSNCLFGSGKHCSLESCLFKDLIADTEIIIEKHLGSRSLKDYMTSGIELEG